MQSAARSLRPWQFWSSSARHQRKRSISPPARKWPRWESLVDTRSKEAAGAIDKFTLARLVPFGGTRIAAMPPWAVALGT
jgi:hypothetical protein